ncbi:MAG: hypothetical protein ACP5P0_06725, partial [Hydrogenobacter sp.]
MKRKILAILLTIVMLSQSFAEEKQQNSKQTQTDQTTTLEDAKKYKKEGKVLLNFRNADISDEVTF